jgi:Protein of unknown function (DUF3501)
MTNLKREDLMSLEEYSAKRADFRAKVLEVKKVRKVALGEHATLYFENELTIRYQIQEMLRIEKIFETEGIEEELDAYNPLIPDGSNWKATFMIEYGDAEERAKVLATLGGVEDTVWVQVEGFDKSFAIANEDMERSTDEKTSAVHFMRFELTTDMFKAIKEGKAISMGIDYDGFNQLVSTITEASRASLMNDLQ